MSTAQTQTALPIAAKRSYGDVGLAVLVLSICSMMFLPLPPWALDLLITANISIAIVVMLVALYVEDALNVTSFPTVLLLTTLFRLALNVSSTRLILLTGHAGSVIQSFGAFVVQGNYVVGGVVFLLLTLIQFIVIAKGSERVAEVGARFTLDAMPGKQMAIDAELRSGALSQDDARKRRRTLARESQFYGAMDGAMKFVKGDAIAGIIITAINILGGLTIGIVQRGLSAGTALQTYGLLTIGDGLVSQIPSLLLSTAAGLVVTRVASEEAGTSLGNEIAGQLFSEPRALRFAAAFFAFAALIPGMPTLPFGLGAAALFLASRRAKKGKVATTVAPAARVVFHAHASVDRTQIRNEQIAWSEDCARLGLAVPESRIETRDAPGCTVTLDGLPLVWSEDPAQRILARRRALPRLLGIQETQSLIERLERTHPALVRAVVPKPVSVAVLTDILKRLVEEDISLIPMRDILETLALHGAAEKDPLMLTELVRQGLRPWFTRRFAEYGTLRAFVLDSSIEEAIRDGIQRTQSGSFLALSPALSKDIVDAVSAVAKSGDVVLSQSDVRRFVRRLLESTLPSIHVLSYSDLEADVEIQPIAVIQP